MKRLTAYDESGSCHAHYPRCFEIKGCEGTNTENCATCDFALQICDRLAAYEDTGLMPVEISGLIPKNARLTQWVNDLQSGMYVNCVCCGHRYGPAKDTPVSMAGVLKQHIEQCPAHPMSFLKAENAVLKEELKKYKAALFVVIQKVVKLQTASLGGTHPPSAAEINRMTTEILREIFSKIGRFKDADWMADAAEELMVDGEIHNE